MRIVLFSLDHPLRLIAIMAVCTLALVSFIPAIEVDTDPENMLAYDEPVRVTHREMKEKYEMYDTVVLGIVNEKHPQGVFNPESLRRVEELTQFVFGLQVKVKKDEDERSSGPDGGGALMREQVQRFEGVVKRDVMAPSNIDHIESLGGGVLRFEWLMPEVPETDEEALEIKERLLGNDVFKNTVVSENGKAMCLYIPITSKDLSYRIYTELNKKIATFDGDEEYFITGLPVAEDVFGVEMFIQMAYSAPAAMMLIFVLMLLFFRKIVLIISPLIVAMVSVMCTMGLLIATGNAVHIMSSMIPIFIMPIAVLDSIHILSEFFDRYQETRDRRQTIVDVMKELFTPMVFTSLTSAAGFASLILTPIPPVQVFGVFVAFGILLAWLLTITFIPAYTTFISEKSLENFGLERHENRPDSPLGRLLLGMQRLTGTRPRIVIAASLVLLGIAAHGISLIQINDNPVKWFTEDHPIRVADRVLNEHFAGTYMAYLALSPGEALQDVDTAAERVKETVRAIADEHMGGDAILLQATSLVEDAAANTTVNGFFEDLVSSLWEKADASDEAEAAVWEDMAAAVDLESLARSQIFKRPETLEYLARLDEHLVSMNAVGKVNDLPKVVKKINQELHDGDPEYHSIPPSFAGVGQCLLSFQSSHWPERLWHFTLPDYTGANLWLQLKSGDNKDMERTVRIVEEFIRETPPPMPIKYDWFGLTYLNVIWQQKMVSGMLRAFLGSFLVVFIMMVIFFRSLWWGLICMIPLTVTIGLIYGVIGLIGKDLRHARGRAFLSFSGPCHRFCHPLPGSLTRDGGPARLLGKGGRTDFR